MNRKLTVHQAFYGEVNRAHSTIGQTLVDPELTSFLLTFTDRPGALPPGVTLAPYISAASFSKYLIISKTFPDPTTSRGGMVFTHVLIFDIDEATTQDDFEGLLKPLASSVNDKHRSLEPVEIVVNNIPLPNFKRQPTYIQESIREFISGKIILLSGNIDSVAKVVQTLWSCSNPETRKKVKFRVSFSPADIESVKDLTLVSIQPEFLSRWRGVSVIDSDRSEEIEITSPSQSLFLGHTQGNPFHNFVNDLNVSIADYQDYLQCESLFLDYNGINQIEDGNKIRQSLRLLTKLSPSPSDAKEIKGIFLSRLSSLIKSRKETNVKALRNMDLSSYSDGEKVLTNSVSAFVQFEMEHPGADAANTITEFAILSTSGDIQSWWREAVHAAIQSAFSRHNAVGIATFFAALDWSIDGFDRLISIISVPSTEENTLRKYLPGNLSKKTLERLADFAGKQHWYLLYADVSCLNQPITDALINQLEIESDLQLDDSKGVRYLAGKLPSSDLLKLALSSCSDKLIQLIIPCVINDSRLMKELTFDNDCWLKIWTAVSLKSKSPFAGLSGQERAFVFKMLDLLIEEHPVDTIFLDLLSQTAHLDLSTYSNRSEVWRRLPAPARQRFIDATAPAMLSRMLAGTSNPSTFESEIVSAITSDDAATHLLSENRSNFDPVLIVFENFGDRLKDKFLADFIRNYWPTISENQSERLGKLITRFDFEASARSVYDKIAHNASFEIAYRECQDLVHLNWWESISVMPKGKQDLKSKPTQPSRSSRYQARQNLNTVVILTALKEEYDAVRANLIDVVDADRNDTNYEAGIFALNGREIAKVIIRECGAKNTTSAQETERAIQYFTPNMMLFVGIAGSRKPKDFSVGDVIFPERVYSYEGGKSEKETFVARPDLANMTFTLMETAKKIRRKDEWKGLIKGTWSSEVKANLGIIASGEQVVEHYESDVGKILTKHFNDTSAVEMEGFGFAKAAGRQGRQTSNMLVGIVRGISDVIEQHQAGKSEDSSDRRPTSSKEFASDTAAAFAFWLILKTYT